VTQTTPPASGPQIPAETRRGALPGDVSLRLDQLLRQTYSLWEPGWITFTWRAYTYDHVQRVRGLALTLCESEGGDSVVTELAAYLHDITKLYDGEIIVDRDGHRMVDEDGLWHNHFRPPAGHNRVTELYERLGLAGSLHSESGAAIARHLLPEYGIDDTTSGLVAQVIRDHLRPPTDAPIESLCLYDADTIDANIGMPSFVRNIYIHLHFYDVRRDPAAPTIADVMRTDPMSYLHPYVTERLPTWAAGKRRDFIPRLRTKAGRVLALRRIKRLERLLACLAQELDRLDALGRGGCLPAVVHFMTHTDDPSIAKETAFLANGWLKEATPEARWFIENLQAEMAGMK